MNEHDPLLVPLQLHALVVNEKVRKSQNFRRWQMNYSNLDRLNNPEPKPFDGGQTDFSASANNEGIYLMWTLPEALRHGVENKEKDKVEFPLVPNRWLIVRCSGHSLKRTTSAWMVESDFIDNDNGTSPYLNPFLNTHQKTLIGRKVPLNQYEGEETNAKDLFLTAIGPGHVMYASHQPNMENVFSIHDDLTNQYIEAETLSYMVIGWYSNPKEDILYKWQLNNEGDEDYSETLKYLKWSVKDEIRTSRQSIYHGMVYGVRWEQKGDVPASPRDTVKEKVKVAVGNTSIDALTSLIKKQLGDDSSAKLIEAFQYGFLHSLDEPGGLGMLDQKIHNAWFGSNNGGTRWEIVDKERAEGTDSTAALSKEEMEKEERWLAKLNRNQSKLDLARFQLTSLQRELYEMWWKKGYATSLGEILGEIPYNTSIEQFNDAQGYLVTRIKDKSVEIDQLTSQVPYAIVPSDPEFIESSINEYARKNGISANRQLKAVSKPRFWHANDPVILIAGVNHDMPLKQQQSLACRYMDEVVTGFSLEFNGSTKSITINKMKSINPLKYISNLPEATEKLLQEFFLLDPNNADVIAEKVLHTSDNSTIKQLQSIAAGPETDSITGSLPAKPSLTKWSQPWLPLYIEWEVDWYTIPYQAKGRKNWEFDGKEYVLTTANISEPKTIMGSSFLTPQVGYVFQSRLKKFLEDHPDDEDLKSIYDSIESIDKWDFLSQTLMGFNDQLALRNPRSSLAPRGDIAKSIGNQCHAAPQSLMINEPRHRKLGPSTFEGIRSGQFIFKRIRIVDRFGQTIEVLTGRESKTFHPIIAEGLSPTSFLLPTERERLVQLPPRLLQAGRLNFDLVSANDDSKVINIDEGVNPVCGWILPNHLDQGLSVFDNTGFNIGEMQIGINAAQKEIVQFQPAPSGKFNDLDTITNKHYHLGQFLSCLQSKGPQAFRDLLTVIDETLWTIDPLGARDDQTLSVLMGRPIAIVRIRLQFELMEAPFRDPAWPYTFEQELNKPGFTIYTFSVKLGNLDYCQDGLLGYFLGDNYDRFNSIHIPESADKTSNQKTYIKEVRSGNYINLKFIDSHSMREQDLRTKQKSQYITMLMDPRASVHAQTGILPLKRLDLPSKFVNDSLKNMEVTFRTGPLLTDIQTVDVKNANGEKIKEKPCLLIPTPTERNGEWIWLEKVDEKKWQEIDIAGVDQKTRFSHRAPSLREGVLKLKGAIDTNEDRKTSITRKKGEKNVRSD